MTVVAVVGDAATTTSVALAAGWPRGGDAVILEADPSGGSLAAWLDTPTQPSLATIVANVGTDPGLDRRSIMETFTTMTRNSESGIRFVANAVRSRSAHRAIEEAAVTVLPALAADVTTVIADVGTHQTGHAPSPALKLADVVVVVHRQSDASAAAATVRVERLTETVEELAHLDATFVLAVVGNTPFDPMEIGAFIEQSTPGRVSATVSIADDPLTAATIAGRAGVTSKRLRRLPLMRDAANLGAELSALVERRRVDGHRQGARKGAAR